MIRIKSELRQRLQSPIWLALALFVTARLIGLALGGLLWWLGLVPAEPTRPDQVYLSIEPVAGPITGWTLGVWQRLDSMYYLQIAARGYAPGSEIVFPPLYPLLIRLVGTVLGGQYLVAALLISSVACVGSLMLLYDITAEELDAGSARRAIVYQIFFPTAYILIAAYAESLTLCLMLLAFRWARRERWWHAGVAMFFAALTRLQGAMLILPLTYLYLRRFGFTRHALRPEALSLIAGLAAVVGYNLYLMGKGFLSVPAAFSEYWYSVPSAPGTDLLIALQTLLTGGLNLQRSLSLGLTGLFIVLTIIAFRRLPFEYGLYMTGTLLFTLSRHEMGGRALLSVSRHMLTMFPAFMLLGMIGQNRWLHRLILYPSLALYLFLMGVFFMWGFAE